MGFIDWDESFSTGISLIDDQHKRLFEIINNYHSGIRNTEVTFQLLLSYVDFHFNTEERYFEEFKYEDAAKHIMGHIYYEEEIYRLYIEYHSGNYTADRREAIEGFIKGWITRHVKVSDKEYVQCFREHGLQ